MKRVVKTDQSRRDGASAVVHRSDRSNALFVVRDKAARLLGVKQGKAKIKKEVVKRLVIFRLLGIAGFAGVPPFAVLSIKARIMMAKVKMRFPYIDDPRRFPEQTMHIPTYDPATEVVHVFLRHKSKLRCVGCGSFLRVRCDHTC